MKTRLTLSAFLLLLAAAPLHAQTWSNNGTDWGAITNWTGGVVPNSTTANATFNGTITYQPDIGASNYTITRLNVGSASSNVTLGGSTGNLTFTSTTNTNLITVEAGKSLTLSSGVTLDSALTGSQWAPNFSTGAGSVVEFASGSTLTSKIGSGNATSIAYALQGSGTYNFNGAFVASNTTNISNKGNGTINWNPSSTSGTINIQQSGTAGSQFNLYKSAGTITFGSAGSGTRTITIKADALTFGTTTMWNATDAGTNPYKNLLAIDDGTDSAISVNLTRLDLTSNSANGTNELFAGDNDTLRFSGTINRTGGTTATIFTKSGNGTVVFSGSGNYADATVISAGTLLINGNFAAATGDVSVQSGATLGGNGTSGGAITVDNNGILAPGTETDATTTLTLNNKNLTILGVDSKINLNITGTAAGEFDKIAGINVFAQGGDITFTLTGSYVDGDLWNMFGFVSKSGTFNSVALTGSYTGSLNWDGTNWTNNIGGQSWKFDETNGTLSVIPEPSTWALLAFSLTTAMVLRRRRIPNS